MGATDDLQPMLKPFPIDRVRVPLLKIYGSNAYPRVQRQATQLATLLQDMHPPSSQLQIPGADHYFEGFNKELVEGIRAWLNRLPEAAD